MEKFCKSLMDEEIPLQYDTYVRTYVLYGILYSTYTTRLRKKAKKV